MAHMANEPQASFMNDEKREYFKTLLFQMLYDMIKDNGNGNTPNVKFPDPSDRATLETALNFDHSIKERNRGQIRLIEGVLEKIENGTYGLCEECEEEISENRLKAMPTATLCIDCKRMQEEEESRRGF